MLFGKNYSTFIPTTSLPTGGTYAESIDNIKYIAIPVSSATSASHTSPEYSGTLCAVQLDHCEPDTCHSSRKSWCRPNLYKLGFRTLVSRAFDLYGIETVTYPRRLIMICVINWQLLTGHWKDSEGSSSYILCSTSSMIICGLLVFKMTFRTAKTWPLPRDRGALSNSLIASRND